ncbi:hypothetical protein CVT26_014129 [Gymnopilus dilepis]|uniref:Uncharacterized protein n=1 Tax=Gymnopilus dilepis TaxID=231916 RepID=A0A409Y819_9AGAR|nr:hypothetical protein CVT26_014129 [Gymnopilus dilepis]
MLGPRLHPIASKNLLEPKWIPEFCVKDSAVGIDFQSKTKGRRRQTTKKQGRNGAPYKVFQERRDLPKELRTAFAWNRKY